MTAKTVDPRQQSRPRPLSNLFNRAEDHADQSDTYAPPTANDRLSFNLGDGCRQCPVRRYAE